MQVGVLGLTTDGRVHHQIQRWARELIDLSRRNRSLYFKPLKRGTLNLVWPAPADLFRILMSGGKRPVYVPRHGDDDEPWTVQDCVADASGNQVVTDRTRARDLVTTLKSLHRSATQDLMDRGVQTLYVCFGMLHWTEKDRGDEVRSPLVFVPVVLGREAASDHFTISRSDEDVVLNPSLTVLLDEQYGVDLQIDDVELQDQVSIGDLFERVVMAVRGRGWSVEPTAILKRATFHKEAMYRDLLSNIDTIAAHEIIQSLAGGDVEGEIDEIEIPDETEIDKAAPPEDVRLIRDADASQRLAVEAARRGASFVMDGPPGTGKSQTIANMIAQLLADGRSVLFVSEKAAALEVVARRLEEPGLKEFALELHSHKASRKEVVRALATALDTTVEARPRLSSADLDAVRSRRQELSAYAEAVNEVRQPLGRSVAWVAGRLARLAHLPAVPTPTGVDDQLSEREANDYLDRFDQLARSWAPVEDDQFVWSGFVGDSFSATEQSRLDRELQAFERLNDELADAGDALAFEMRLPSPRSAADCRALVALAEHVDQQPLTHRPWWSKSIEAAMNRLEAMRQSAASRQRQIDQLSRSYVDRWQELPPDAVLQVRRDVSELGDLRPGVTLNDQIDPRDLSAAARSFRHLADVADYVRGDVAYVEQALGLSHRTRSLGVVIDLANIAQTADASVRPEVAWVTPAVMERVREAVDLLEPLVNDHAHKHDELMQLFTEDVYDLDLETIAVRFEQNTGLKKLSGAFRSAKKELAGATRGGRATKHVRAKVGEALEAQHVRQQLDAEEDTHRDLLGSHYRQRATDTSAVSRAIELLTTALDRLGDEYNPHRVAAQLAGDAPEDPLLGQRASVLAGRLTEAADGALAALPRAVDLHAAGFDDVPSWARSVADRLDELAQVVELVFVLRRGPTTLPELIADLTIRRKIFDAEEQVALQRHEDMELFGRWYAAFETDWRGLASALQWTARLHEIAGGPLSDRAADRLHRVDASLPVDELRVAVQQYDKAKASLGGRFDEAHAGTHDTALDGTFEDARDHLAQLRERLHEPLVWIEWTEKMQSLEADGWHAALAVCRDERVPSRDLPDVLEHAMYAAWLDDVLLDPRLRVVRGPDRDALVQDFAKRDRKLVHDAAERVIEVCNRRRPRTSIGAASTILREAQKKSRHMPVRRLLEQTVEVATDLKPCFMMSPLSVSQFLPADYRFDVVVFDEASQITPADAVNCIYRGSQLIVAGDDKQLPPTNFFDSELSDGDDGYDEDQLDEFESVLGLAKGSAIMRSLPLRWHYRSQHEALITYSNHEFYEGNLVTYPGADEHRADLGVELIVTDGHYRRGTRHDNPAEAEMVARRVQRHATEHPNLSLGVVAFSRAQADAVEDAIDRLRREHPELEHYFDASRLDGFFVKNLENAQGDERDIILFTVGYGPDEAGKFTMNFGPVIRQGGWRRLNVAVTRARRRVEVITSFHPERMDTRTSTNEGLIALQRYLNYADRGLSALAVDLSQSDGELESPLEESVNETLRSWGYDVTPQVGTAGYRVDLGVRDPDAPGRFMLGVECDGRAYHSSRIARDRDRLRQEVLEGLGWRLHRIWGPSWYRDRATEERRLQDALEQAAQRQAPPRRRPTKRRERQLEQIPTGREGDVPPWAEVYKVASIGGRRPLGRANDAANRPTVRSAVEYIVRHEGPVHVDVVSRRIADHFGHNLTRATREAVGGAARALARRDLIRLDGDIASMSNDVRVRVPDERDSDTKRDIQHIPADEIAEAVHRLLGDARVASEDELLVAVRDLFGYGRLGARIQAALDAALTRLERAGRISRGDDGRLRPTDV